MNITADDVALAERLGVPLRAGEIPHAIVRLLQLVGELQRRVDELEKRGKR